MPQPNIEAAEYESVVSAYVVRTDLGFEEPKIMLYWNEDFQQWTQFCGHKEPTESPWQAMRRQLLEGTGYDMDQLQVLQPRDRLRDLGDVSHHPVPLSLLTHPMPDGGAPRLDTSFAFVSNQTPRNTPVEPIVIKSYNLTELDRINTFKDIREIARFAIINCLPDWEAVPARKFR